MIDDAPIGLRGDHDTWLRLRGDAAILRANRNANSEAAPIVAIFKIDLHSVTLCDRVGDGQSEAAAICHRWRRAEKAVAQSRHILNRDAAARVDDLDGRRIVHSALPIGHRVSVDRRALGARGLMYERLDQLTVEVILGVR